jgi:hypothetical protein
MTNAHAAVGGANPISQELLWLNMPHFLDVKRNTVQIAGDQVTLRQTFARYLHGDKHCQRQLSSIYSPDILVRYTYAYDVCPGSEFFLMSRLDPGDFIRFIRERRTRHPIPLT